MRLVWISGCAIIAATAIPLSAAPQAERPASQAPKEQGQREGGGQQGQGRAEKAPLRVEIVDNEQNAARRAAREQEAERDQQQDREFRHREYLATIAQAGFALLGTILLFLTLHYTRKATQAAINSASHAGTALGHAADAVDVATRSAIAAEKTIAQSHEHFILEMRPWVTLVLGPGLAQNCVIPRPGVGLVRTDFFLANATIKNIGKMPADRARIKIEHCFTSGDNEPVWDLSYENDEAPIAPGDEGSFRSGPVFSDEFDEVFNNQKHLFIRAAVLYLNPLTGAYGETIGIYEAEISTPFSQYLAGNVSGIRFRATSGCRLT